MYDLAVIKDACNTFVIQCVILLCIISIHGGMGGISDIDYTIHIRKIVKNVT